MKAKLDENLPRTISRVVEAFGHDVDSVVDEGLGGEGDAQVLAEAGRAGRFLMTLDRGFGDVRRYPPGSPLALRCCESRFTNLLRSRKHYVCCSCTINSMILSGASSPSVVTSFAFAGPAKSNLSTSLTRPESLHPPLKSLHLSVNAGAGCALRLERSPWSALGAGRGPQGGWCHRPLCRRHEDGPDGDGAWSAGGGPRCPPAPGWAGTGSDLPEASPRRFRRRR